MEQIIEQVFVETQEEKEIVCIMCYGQHGNNSMCQMPGRG